MVPDTVIINGKNHRHLVQRSLDDLVHLRQLAEIAVVNYRMAIVNYPPDRMRIYALPYLAQLQTVVAILDAHIALKSAT